MSHFDHQPCLAVTASPFVPEENFCCLSGASLAGADVGGASVLASPRSRAHNPQSAIRNPAIPDGASIPTSQSLNPHGTSRGRSLHHSCLPALAALLLFTSLASGQEALRNAMTGDAATRERRAQARQPEQNYTVRYGDFRLLATPSLSLEWNDNIITSDEEPRDDFIVKPFLQLRGSYPLTAQNVLNLSIGAGYDYYTRHDEFSAWRVQSGSEISFDIFIKDVWINLHDRFSYVQDATREAAVAGTARYGNLDNTIGLLARWDLRDVTLSVGYDHKNVISQTSQFEQQDRASELVIARAGFQVHPRITAGVEASGSFTDYVEPILNDNTGYSVGGYGSWQAGDYFQITPRAGYTSYSFDQTSNLIETGDLNAWYADLTVTHDPTDWVSYSLSAGREVRLGVSSDAIEDYYARLQANWHVIKDVMLHTSLSYEHGKQGAGNISGNLSEEYDWYGGSVGMTYALMRKLRVGAHYRFTLRSSDNANREYTQNVVGLTLTYLMQ